MLDRKDLVLHWTGRTLFDVRHRRIVFNVRPEGSCSTLDVKDLVRRSTQKDVMRRSTQKDRVRR